MVKKSMYQDEQLELVIDNFKTINRKVKQELLPVDTGYYCQNFRYDNLYGYLYKRSPRRKYNGTTLGTDPIRSSYRYYKNSTNVAYHIISRSSLLQVGNDSAGTFANIQTGLVDSARWKFITYKDLCYGFNGINSNQVFDGTNIETMGVPIPIAPSGVDSGAGTKPNGAYYYKVTYTIDGYQEGSASDASSVVNTAAHTVTVTIPTSLNTRVTARTIYRTIASGTTLFYKVATVSNNVDLTYSDTTADADLDTTTLAPTDYGAPGSYKYPLLHKERVHLAYNGTYKSRIIFSDIRSGMSYPDVFPASNYLDIAKDDGDELKGIAEDTLGNYVVFKENSVRVINTDTDSPVGWTIGKPVTNLGCIAPYSIIKTPSGIVYVSRWGENKNRLMLWTGSGVKHIFSEIDPILDSCDLAAVKDIVCHYHNGKIHLSYIDRVTIGTSQVDSYTKLLLHCNGQLYDTSFIDSETTPKTVTNATVDNTIDDEDMADISDWADGDVGDGASTQVTFDSKSCMKLDSGSVGAENYAIRSQDIGSFGDFTSFTFSAYFDTLGTKANEDVFYFLADDGTTRLNVMFNTDGLRVNNGSAEVLISASAVVVDTWQKWAFQVNWIAQTVDIYLNDVLVAANVDCSVASAVAEGTITFAQYGSNTAHCLTYIDYFKAGTGRGVYVDTTAGRVKFGTGSARFDGGSYLSLADSADWDFGTGDATIDGWVNFNTLPTGFMALVSHSTTASNSWYLVVQYTGGVYKFNFVANNSSYLSDSISISAGILYHYAVVITGGYINFYLNGILNKSVASSENLVGTANLNIGCRGDGTDSAYFLDGNIDELRISKGIARWTANFTPPTLEYGYGYNNNEIIMNLETMSNIVIDKKNIDSYCEWNAGADLGQLLTGSSDTTGFCYIEETDISPSETTIEVQWTSGKHTFGNSRIRKRLHQVKIEFERTVTTGSLTFYYALDGGAESSFSIDFATYASAGEYIYQFPLGTYCFNVQERLLHSDDISALAIKRITYLYNLEPIIPYL